VGSLFGFFPTQTQEERNKETKPHGPGEPEIKGPEGPEQVLREQPHLEGVTRLFPENLFLISYMRFSGCWPTAHLYFSISFCLMKNNGGPWPTSFSLFFLVSKFKTKRPIWKFRRKKREKDPGRHSRCFCWRTPANHIPEGKAGEKQRQDPARFARYIFFLKEKQGLVGKKIMWRKLMSK
jgi:hypothetical protein